MRFFPVFAVLGAIAYTGYVTVGSSGTTTQAQQGDFEWQGRLSSSQVVRIRGVNGPVRAMLASGSQVEVRAVKREGRRGNPADVRIEVVEHDGGVTICALYPSENEDRPNECRADGRGRNNVRNNDTKVEFTVRVPAGVKFVGRTVNGDVEAEGLESEVDAGTVNGDVTIATSSAAQAQTVNGNIMARLGSMLSADLEFETVNGQITVELPAGARADVRAATVNGRIETDFPLTVRGRWGPREMSGTIGGGGPELKLETVNGSIRLIEG